MMKLNHIRSHKGIALGLLALLSTLLITGCKKSPEKIDLSSTHSTAAETMAASTAAPSLSTTAETEPATTAESLPPAGSSQNISTRMNTYSSGKVSIAYPSVTNLPDAEKTAALDALLKKNALSVLDAWEIQEAEDSLSVSCQVLSADRNRITAVYTGTFTPKDAAHPTNVMYSNTVDVGNVSDIGFDRFADPYTMAGYVLSGDCTFYQADDTRRAQLMEIKNDTSLEAYTQMFTNADFPLDGTFPESFSYEDQGVIYFSIPVPHALGDYAIVMFAPDSK